MSIEQPAYSPPRRMVGGIQRCSDPSVRLSVSMSCAPNNNKNNPAEGEIDT